MNLKITRRALMGMAAASMMGALPAMAGESVSTDSENLAISGYDPVAYFTQSRPLQGNPEIGLEWQGARYHFASTEHRDLFEGNPEQYAPRYGGFCAGGVSLGRKTIVDPQAWMIVDGKLYLGGSQGAITYMETDTGDKIAKADENWKTLGVTN
jgi:YHS domain-containing protein